MYELTEHFPCRVIPSNDGKVELTIELEAIHVRVFLQVLDSLSGLFKMVNNKAKASIAMQRVPETLAKGRDYYLEYSSAVVDTFREFVKSGEYSPTQCLSATLRAVKLTYPNASYESVRSLVGKSGDLKKTSYFKDLKKK